MFFCCEFLANLSRPMTWNTQQMRTQCRRYLAEQCPTAVHGLKANQGLFVRRCAVHLCSTARWIERGCRTRLLHAIGVHRSRTRCLQPIPCVFPLFSPKRSVCELFVHLPQQSGKHTQPINYVETGSRATKHKDLHVSR